MKTPVLYLDTSVVGGYFDDEFKGATREFMSRVERLAYLEKVGERGRAELRARHPSPPAA